MQKIKPERGTVDSVNGIVEPPESAPRLSAVKLILAGVVSPILINNISRVLDLWDSNGVYIVAIFVFILLGWFIEYLLPKPTQAMLGGLISYVSISAGVFIDAMLDWSLRYYDRNLWPFEILIWWVLSPIPMIVGIMLGYAFSQKKKRGGKENRGK